MNPTQGGKEASIAKSNATSYQDVLDKMNADCAAKQAAAHERAAKEAAKGRFSVRLFMR
jgi:hypothetical protein